MKYHFTISFIFVHRSQKKFPALLMFLNKINAFVLLILKELALMLMLQVTLLMLSNVIFIFHIILTISSFVFPFIFSVNFTLSSLELASCQMNDEGAQKIARSLKENHTLQYISMKNNGLGNVLAASFGDSLISNNVC